MQQMMTVSSLNTKIKSLLEATFMHIMVEGEIASVTYHHASGHIYFTIKDDSSSIKCVMFRSNAAKLKFRLEKGEHIVVEGSVGVYTPRGEYQFYAVHAEPYGKGALAVAFEQLKKKLEAKGYFEQTSKKDIPRHIEKIALVTAKESAALYDMLKIIEKRWPMVSVTILDTLVQGERAAEEIASALQYADTIGADVIVTGRGGGSVEDLWAFNEEIVADAIYNLKTPVVSAVGHEVDTVISDFVSDLRAPTPSAAIEMILPDKSEVLYSIDELSNRFSDRISQILYHKEHTLKQRKDELLRYSISSRLDMLMGEFKSLSDRYRSVIDYRMKQMEASTQPVSGAFLQQIRFIMEHKNSQLLSLADQYSSSNPRDRVKKGWAKISIEGKAVPLGEIEPGNDFTVEDKNIKIKAKCIEKSNY